MGKEQETIKKIIAIIDNDDFQIGSRLPAERKLSSRLNVSRNTVRNALRKLEAKGIVNIRTGSGCYLLCKYDYSHDWIENRKADSPLEIQNLIEARFLFEPSAVFLSAKKIGPANIKKLEKCLVRISKAIIGMEKKVIAGEDAEFRRIIYYSSKNRFLISTMNQLNANKHLFFQIFDQLSKLEKDSIFADYVEVLNGLKKRDAFLVKETIKKNILRVCKLLIKYADLKIPELIADAIKMNEKQQRR